MLIAEAVYFAGVIQPFSDTLVYIPSVHPEPVLNTYKPNLWSFSLQGYFKRYFRRFGFALECFKLFGGDRGSRTLIQ